MLLVGDGDLSPSLHQVSHKRAANVAGESATVLAACCFAVDYHELSRMDIVTKNSRVQVISLAVRAQLSN